MKTIPNIAKKSIAIFLALVYVFTMSTYITFLASRTHVRHYQHRGVTSQSQHLSNSGAAGNFFDKQHGAFKSIRESKSRITAAFYSVICVAVLAIVCRFQFLQINYINSAAAGLIFVWRPSYLKLRVLRI